MRSIVVVLAAFALISWGAPAAAQANSPRETENIPEKRGEAASKEHGTTFPEQAGNTKAPGEQVSPDKPVPDRSNPSTSHSR
jgi:hypothetical protein